MPESLTDAASSNPTGLRSMFRGFYPPTDEQLGRFLREGLVVLDTNALLDTYRFTETARTEYLAALGVLGDRLWIPNRVGEEFLDRRATVIRGLAAERDQVRTKLLTELEAPTATIARYARRRGASADRVEQLSAILTDAVEKILTELDDDSRPDDTPQIDPDADPVLTQIEVLIDNRIGGAFDPKDLATLNSQWKLRCTGHVPPGYADAKKGERSIGDFLLWEQTLREAKKQSLPVLLVTNDRKPDWTREDGDYVGPRPELVSEMYARSEQPFHLVDVHTFLTLANAHLSTTVSSNTVVEATLLASAEVTPKPDPELTDVLRVLVNKQVSDTETIVEVLSQAQVSSLVLDALLDLVLADPDVPWPPGEEGEARLQRALDLALSGKRDLGFRISNPQAG
ncbi:PIN-like domain-containing protein [Nocardia tengchongensis]|uniref:PIN-like domain-containing protein n=1 Tax=Nocardia tengchongensis TaxID=2055889 RepID=UPI0036819D3D